MGFKMNGMKWICIILAIILTGVLIYLGLRERRLKKQIRELTDYITKVQDLSALPEMRKIVEGQFGILQSEIYKVVTLLKEAYSDEHRQKKYMSDMMSDISHQFKTPLTAISLMADLLMEPEVTQEQRLEYASKIDSQISRMTWLIRNLLTLSQLEAGVLEMKAEEIHLGAMMQDIKESLDVVAEIADVDLQMEVPEAIRIRGDRHWLGEALTNIIKNCIEHTPEGGWVKIVAGQNNICTSIWISDNGKGIEKQHLPHIFERFYKAGNESPNSIGIGLAMAKQIIACHEGMIEVESEVGKGTTFLVKIYG